MKNLFFASLFIVLWALDGCAQNSTSNSKATTIPALAFQTAIQKQGIQVLDVRTASEFNSGHLKSAFQANWNDPKEFENRTQHLDKNQTVYVYCQAGGRSAAAQAFLIEKGFTVVNLEGGMSNWKMNNLPIEGSAHSPQMSVVDFDKVINTHELVLVDIGANWCPPCRKMQPTIEKIRKEQGEKLYFMAVDGGIDIDVMKHLNFETLPTFIIFKKGKEVWRKEGIVEESEFIKNIAN